MMRSGWVVIRRSTVLSGAVVVSALLGCSTALGATIEQAKLTAPGSGPAIEIGAGNFGNAVAISSDGNTALVGAYADKGTVGAAWVFTRSGTTWSEQAKLTAPTSGADKEIGNAAFGADVALSADGNTALIGGNGDNGSLGAAWVFTRTGSTWSERKKLVVQAGASPPLEEGSGQVGFSVALSSDGATAVLGAPKDNANTFLQTGAAFVFTGSGSSWSQQAELIGSGTSFTPNVGWSVAISSDGNTVVAGAPFNAPSGVAGAAFLFTRSGATWSGSTALVAPDSPSPLAETVGQSELGHSVAISADGSVVIAGGPMDGTGATRGAAWVFARSGATWPAVAKLTPPAGTGAGSQFGLSASLSADGGTAFVGGPTDSSAAGAAWRFTGAGPTWTERARLVAPAGTENGAGQFGASVALSGDANTALIGGNVDSGSVGAAWVFVMPPTVSNVSPPSGPAGGGTAVTITGTALDGATAVAFAGAPATSFSVVSNTEIDAVSPPGDPAPVDIRVTTPAGSSALGAADRFTYFPSAPGAPTSVHATAGNKRATVTFAAPRSNGSGIVGYTVAASPGGAHASADGSPVTVTGLRNGTRYTFTVTAKNGIGPGPASAPSNAVTPTLPPHASHVSIKGVGKRKPKLSFTISAGKSAPPVKSIAVKLPKGLRFSGSKHSLAHGTNVRGSKPLKFTAKVKRGVLTITLKRPGSKARVTISPPALATTASLAAKVRLHKAGKVSFAFTVTDGAHTKTKLTSKDKIS